LEYPRGYRFATVLGIALSTVIVVFLKILLENPFRIADALGLLLVCYINSGIVGISLNKGQSLGKHSKYFRFIAFLGAAFITLFPTILYLSYTTYLGEIVSSLSLGPYMSFLFGALMFFLLIGGPVFLIVGIVGIGRQHLKNHKSIFTVLTVILVPLFVYALNGLMAYLTPLRVGL